MAKSHGSESPERSITRSGHPSSPDIKFNADDYPRSCSPDFPEVDESMRVSGEPTKPSIPDGGFDLLRSIQQMLEQSSILNCVIDTAALRYYKGPFMLDDLRLCVPTALFDSATQLILDKFGDRLQQIPITNVNLIRDDQRAFHVLRESEQFEHRCYDDFILRLCPSWVVALDSVFKDPGRDIIRDDRTRLKYPALRDFVQSALDSCQLHNLENLIDSMNLTNEWAEKVGLDLDEAGGPGPAIGRPYSRREIWQYNVKNKTRRIGLKNDPKYYATCFRLRLTEI